VEKVNVAAPFASATVLPKLIRLELIGLENTVALTVEPGWKLRPTAVIDSPWVTVPELRLTSVGGAVVVVTSGAVVVVVGGAVVVVVTGGAVVVVTGGAVVVVTGGAVVVVTGGAVVVVTGGAVVVVTGGAVVVVTGGAVVVVTGGAVVVVTGGAVVVVTGGAVVVVVVGGAVVVVTGGAVVVVVGGAVVVVTGGVVVVVTGGVVVVGVPAGFTMIVAYTATPRLSQVSVALVRVLPSAANRLNWKVNDAGSMRSLLPRSVNLIGLESPAPEITNAPGPAIRC